MAAVLIVTWTGETVNEAVGRAANMVGLNSGAAGILEREHFLVLGDRPSITLQIVETEEP